MKEREQILRGLSRLSASEWEHRTTEKQPIATIKQSLTHAQWKQLRDGISKEPEGLRLEILLDQPMMLYDAE